MAQERDSSTISADGSQTEDIFKLPPFVVTGGTTDRFSDFLGSGNIFDYGAGTISSGIGNVTFGGGGGAAAPSSTQVLQPLTTQGVYEQIYNDELARTNAVRAKQNPPLPPLTNLDRSEIERIADFAVGQVNKVYEDAQRDLDRTQAARQIGQTGAVLPIPLPIPGDLANIINAAQLIGALGNVVRTTNLNVPTPETPSEVVESGGNLSQIGQVGPPSSIVTASQNTNPVTGLIGGLAGAASGIFSGPVAAPAGGYPGLSSTTQQTPTSTTPLIITPGAVGGESTGTGSSTPSVTNPGGTSTPGGGEGINTQTGLSVIGQVLSNVGKVTPSTVAPINEGVDAQTGLAVMTQTQSNVGKTNLQVNPPSGETSTSTTTTVFTTTSTSTSTTGSTSSGGNLNIALNFPASTYTAMPTNPAQRNIFTEGLTSGTAFSALTTTMSNMYGGLAQGYQQQDVDRLYGLAAPGSQFAQAQQNLTGMASGQTMAANQALRMGNIQDVANLASQAGGIFQASNPYLQQAQSVLGGRGTSITPSAYDQQLAALFNQGPQFDTIKAAEIAAGTGGQISGAASLNDPVLAAARQQALSAGMGPLEQQLLQSAQTQLGLGGQLSGEEQRLAQQAAREAYGARGQVMGQGAAAQEVLNRQAYAQQRQAERQAFAQNVNQQLMAGQQLRNQFGLGVIGAGQAAAGQDLQAQLANQAAALDIAQRNQAAQQQAALANQAARQQAYGQNIALGQQLSAADTARQQQNIANAMQNVNLQRAVAFNPFDVILGQQYGQQTQNVGTTQGLFQQAGNLAAGNLAYQPVIQTYNPFGVYPADVYGTNVNALNAAQISEANRAAALEAAKLGQTGTYAQALGSFLGSPTGQTTLGGIGNWLAGLFGQTTSTTRTITPGT